VTPAHNIDVVVVGEILIELSSTEPFTGGSSVTLGFSGDAMNAAAAAAAAGARTAVLTRIADDALGQAILGRLTELGVDTSLVRLVPGQHGTYFVHSDPAGDREFVYARRGSAASQLAPQDIADARVEDAQVVLSSGVTGAISATADAAVQEAARRGRMFVYDPNFRPGLVSAAAAARSLRRLAPYAALVTPAAPSETRALLGCDDPVVAARTARGLGANAVAVTRGAEGVFLDDGTATFDVPGVPAPTLVDQTGAGDSLVGTVVGRLAVGDSLLEAIRLGSAAASLSMQGQGGTGFVATLAQTRDHLESHGSGARQRT